MGGGKEGFFITVFTVNFFTFSQVKKLLVVNGFVLFWASKESSKARFTRVKEKGGGNCSLY